MKKRTLATLSLLAVLTIAGCKSSENAETAASDATAAAGQPASTSDMATKAKAKPQAKELKGQAVDGGAFKMTVPNGWAKAEKPDAAGQFFGELSYSADGEDPTKGFAEVLKGTFPYTSDEADKKAVWAAVQAANKAAFENDGTFGEDYETKDGFSYSVAFEGKKLDAYVYFLRKGDTVYYVDAGGDQSKLSEADAWSIIESFEIK